MRRTGFSVAADGSYAACLADAGAGAWYPERWTLGGPEPYTVALPGNQPEEADTQVLPLPDGRVLIRRGSPGRHDIALLYPTGPGTGEVPVGFLHGEEVRLLPPLATGSAYAVGYADGTSTVWLVHGGQGLERLARVEGRCTGGVWLDRGGRTLALDREVDGRVKTVAVDLVTGGVSALLQLTADSDDRLLMADPDSGLLLVRSDAPGTERLGWGVLGGGRPVRFPACLRDVPGPEGGRVEPVAVQPGRPLAPESCAVLLRIGTRSALWRPAARRLASLPTPPGWLAGSAWWSRRDTLRLPFARAGEPYGGREPWGREPWGPEPYGVRDVAAEEFLPYVRPVAADGPARGSAAGTAATARVDMTSRQLIDVTPPLSPPAPARAATVPPPAPAAGPGATREAPRETSRPAPAPAPEQAEPALPKGPLGRVVPLQQAPLAVGA
ncbi:hypothetical protein POF50_002160 [Streptomyces sp. SL13]|uniref:Uncharacterized protein n=1 Tax=Streptantibioticus silvisoli TaxID=2705255 RepID=A0AA90KEL5_9ACTN|nr:hypothetical protein [Streptantibioticus silvisoli]